jgi:hypothetical protein
VSGSLLGANILGLARDQSTSPALWVFLNPISACAAALADVRPTEINATTTLRPLLLLRLLSQGTVAPAGDVFVLPLYRATWAVYIGVGLLLFWGSVRVLDMTRMGGKLRLRWADAILLVLLVSYGALLWLSREWWLAGLGSGS